MCDPGTLSEMNPGHNPPGHNPPRTKYTPKPNTIAELKTALLSIWNDLPQELTHR